MNDIHLFKQSYQVVATYTHLYIKQKKACKSITYRLTNVPRIGEFANQEIEDLSLILKLKPLITKME
jgi:hypothetical protein